MYTSLRALQGDPGPSGASVGGSKPGVKTATATANVTRSRISLPEDLTCLPISGFMDSILLPRKF